MGLGRVLLLCCFAASSSTLAQKAGSAGADWQKAAGGAAAFEVASVREDKGEFKTPSFALSADAWFRDPNGRFHADFGLPTYITFAYKIWQTPAEQSAMLAKLPEWVKMDRFAIEAVAPLNATKDQYRLMMQNLLAERFGLKLHFEERESPVLAMVLVKAGTPGPRLVPHEKGQPCDEKAKPETYPPQCYGFFAKPGGEGVTTYGSRASSMDLIGNFVGSLAGGSGEIGRRVVDQTRLTGLWDFTVEGPPPGQAGAQVPSATGPTALAAVQEQLGIKLKPAVAKVSVVVIDHLERLSEN
jgi:uncharacterized protein (TIGR03435 family)